jgi:hypothetical protein
MEVKERAYPENYPSDALAILDAMSFTDGKAVKLLGSMAIRSQQYAGDYDGFEVVKKSGNAETALKELANKFQEIIRRLGRMPNVSIGDIKAGSIEEWRIFSADAIVKRGRVTGYNAEEAKRKVDELKRNQIFTPAEAKKANELLKPSLTPIEFLKARKELRPNIVRWTPAEVLAGQKTLVDGTTYTLEEAFNSPTISKLDVIAFVQNNKYTEFSMLYQFEVGGKVLNPDNIGIEDSLREDILYYTAENKPFKVLKRQFALAKFKHNNYLLKKLTPVLNSDLGRLYSLSSDIGVLIDLLEGDHKVDLNKVRYEIDQFKFRLGNIFENKHILKDEHKLLGHINSALKATSKKGLLQHLEPILESVDKALKLSTPSLSGGTHRTDFLKDHKLEDRPYSLKELAKIADERLNTLQEVYNRGIGAYKSNPQSVRMKGTFKKGVNAPMSKKLSPQHWAMARVYSFLDGNPKHDNDLRKGK